MSGYGTGQGGNRVYFSLKVKRGTEIDPHMEVRKHNGSSYEKQEQGCSYVEGKFAGIDFGTYKWKEKDKDKISVTLVNTETKEAYVLQSAMNSHARGLMLCLCRLFADVKGEIGLINISVYAKDGFPNISIKHNNEYVNWYLDWDQQKELIDNSGEFADYSELEAVLLEKWKGAKTFIDGFAVYKELLESVAGADQPESTQAAPAAGSGAPAPTEEPENLNPDDELDDLPF